ncbi:MAG: S9 family peptidase [Planctomycetes bacterium]|jgi:dipeptidyl aminopeptidase/acylaminoacyl peptidase|nr:S9 family peptidase [Planctomycetota bacterium]
MLLPNRRSPLAALLSFAALVLAGCQSPPGQAILETVPQYDAATFYATTSLFGASFSPDGTNILLTSDEDGVFNVYTIGTDGGAMRRVTNSDADATFSMGYFPKDERLLYTRDQGGNELNHVFVREVTGQEIDLTPGENLRASFAGWTADDRSFFVVSNERDPEHFDLYRYDTERTAPITPASAPRGTEIIGGYRRQLVYENPGGFDVSDIGPDGRWISLTKVRNNADSDLYLLDLSNVDEGLIHVTPHEGNISHGSESFSPDGATLFYTSDEGSEFRRVWSFDVKSQQRKLVLEDDWDIQFYRFSRDGRFLVTGVNRDASTDIRVYETNSGKELRLPEVPAGDIAGMNFQRDGTKVAFYVNGDASPSNLYVMDLESKELEQLSATLSAKIDSGHLVTSEVVRYPSFDGELIPALLYRPLQASAEDPVPALVWVHGGPGGQCRKGYKATIQHLVNHGYAILAVNNRGSSGYGKTFFHMDDRDHGGADLKDCVEGRKYLETLSWVDGDRVGIIGGSYGGYMVCAALAFEPDAFEVGIDIFGVTNWVRTLEGIPSWWTDFREALYAELGDPKADRDRLMARSPLLHAKKIRRPLLVIQGANDPRVIQAESDEMVAAVRGNGVPVEYVLFQDEGHGFRRKENRITASEAYLSFLKEHL